MNASEILVTGGTGLLGRRVAYRLRSAEREVRVLSRSRRPGTVWADLLTGEKLDEATEGIDTVIHCASSARKTRQIDVEGTERLLEAGGRAGVSHFVFISIVGVDRNPYFPYYRMKLEVERIVESFPVPWTILRATQFHELVLRMLRFLERLPIMPIPKGFLLQPIDVGEVADRKVELALADPAGRVPDVGGPEVRTMAELARAYLGATGRRRKVLEVPLPGKFFRAAREGAMVCPEEAYGKIRWEDFLRERVVIESEAYTRSSGHDRSPVRSGWLRTGLLLLAATPLVVGLWALLLPRSFYDDFPSEGRDWVSALGPYDEHLVRDVGALNLALCALLVFAAVVLERLVQAALVAWLVYAIPHFAFHLTILYAFSLGYYLANAISLGLLVLLPLILLLLSGSYLRETEDGGTSG